ncbi:hypothetical protein [Streptomyces chartreusis]|uniref:hypothetical protein n=1 Tax=Streptomyces chartreusis TaxID=1969 RepID=UPI00365FE54E
MAMVIAHCLADDRMNVARVVALGAHAEPFMRAGNGAWAKFTDAVHADAPQTVIEEQTDPRGT